MSDGRRFLAAMGLLGVGVIAWLFAGGGQVGQCLGPLGVTAVQCAKATGVIPGTVDIGLPILGLTIAAAALVLAPVPVGRRSIAAVGAILGGLLGASVYLALRPRTMDGFDSTGAWISLVRPIEDDAVAAAVIFGAILGAFVAIVLAALTAAARRTWSTRT
jgi:hypothetical protein